MKFKWNFPEDRYNSLRSRRDDEDDYMDYIGNVRVGNLCYDIVERERQDLWFDLYVGGVDTGYGYTMTNSEEYPYDLCDEGCFKWDDDLTEVSFEQFKSEVETYIEEHLQAIEGYVPNPYTGETVNLIEKANEELNEW